MKKIKYIAIILIGASMIASCHKLGIAPLNIISDADIFGTENGVTAYLSGIYNTLPMEDFIYEPNTGFMINDGGRWQSFYHPGALDGELAGPYGGTGDAIGGFGFWDYTDIRTINYMLQTLPKYASNFAQQEYEQYMGEAYFCRAYFYFALVKRYGGVPIITLPQNPTDDSATLYVHRAKEEDVYNFIASDLDSAYDLLPETSDRGRANKYVAASYKSLAMLFAGSIARYGSQNYVAGPAKDQGIVGIPSADANKFFQEAYDAAKLVEGHYSLYEKETDLVKNYRDVFLDQSSPENIFVRDYSLTSPTTSSSAPHSWDATMSCIYFTANGVSRAYPTLDLVERWGSLTSVVTNPDGTPKRFDDINGIKPGLEPRLRASIYFPGDTLRNKIFDIRRGIYLTFSGSAAQEANSNLSSPNDVGSNLLLAPDASVSTMINGVNMTIVGQAGAGTANDSYTRTAFYVGKYVDYNKTQAECNLYESTQSYIDMRYAEVLLNRAEAAMELGTGDMKADAIDCINQLRQRAGGPNVSTNITIDTVRNEREKELCFEHQYWWDIRRWRIADQILDNTQFHALLPYYVANEKKYIFLRQIEPYQRSYTFTKQFYYEPIPGGELGKNPNLYPNNPGF